MMSADVLEVIEGGLLTTVQDLGRYGYQRYGVPVSGAMDLFALRAANLLTGTDEGAAGLEITLQGPRLRFLTDTVVALTGADLDPRLEDSPIPMWCPTAVAEGAVLSFGQARAGLRTYLAVAGGFDVPLVLGSRSTFTRTGLGGFEGRPLRALDRLAAWTNSGHVVHGRRLAPEDIPPYEHHRHSLRVILGPQDDAFTSDGIDTFLSAEYIISPKSDRIGSRLDGPAIEHRSGPDIVSDGAPFGAIQVAGDGLPIILMADRGTTGGYAKVATVISADLPRLAQALPRDRVSFSAVSTEEALVALREQEARLERLVQSARIAFTRRQYTVSLDGTSHEVKVGLTPDPGGPAGAPQASAAVVDVVQRAAGGRLTINLVIAPVVPQTGGSAGR